MDTEPSVAIAYVHQYQWTEANECHSGAIAHRLLGLAEAISVAALTHSNVLYCAVISYSYIAAMTVIYVAVAPSEHHILYT